MGFVMLGQSEQQLEKLLARRSQESVEFLSIGIESVSF
jgi:hypothetical protein